MGYRVESIEFNFSFCNAKITAFHFANHANILLGSKLQSNFQWVTVWKVLSFTTTLEPSASRTWYDSGWQWFFFKMNSYSDSKSSFTGENIFWRAQTMLQNTYRAENWRNNFSSSSFLLVNSVFLKFSSSCYCSGHKRQAFFFAIYICWLENVK